MWNNHEIVSVQSEFSHWSRKSFTKLTWALGNFDRRNTRGFRGYMISNILIFLEHNRDELKSWMQSKNDNPWEPCQERIPYEGHIYCLLRRHWWNLVFFCRGGIGNLIGTINGSIGPQGGPLPVFRNGLKFSWVCLGWFHPTFFGVITPFVTSKRPPCKNPKKKNSHVHVVSWGPKKFHQRNNEKTHLLEGSNIWFLGKNTNSESHWSPQNASNSWELLPKHPNNGSWSLNKKKRVASPS